MIAVYAQNGLSMDAFEVFHGMLKDGGGAAEEVDADGESSSTIANCVDRGGRKNIFKQKFDVRAGEKLLKTSHFFLSTETGAVAGLLFISTEKIAFCSQRSISFNIPNWQHNDTVEQVNILFIIFFMSPLGKVLFN
ncbi:hypothetical protein NC652_003565 [Populus alba x Populus x berolinensis]|nr:hypothetical protein NC652_003565 [Populus alba x Populus x berolinensis]